MEPNNNTKKKKEFVNVFEKEITTIKVCSKTRVEYQYILTYIEYQLPNDKITRCVKVEDAQGNVKKLFL